MTKQSINLFWFRRDLRLHDNAGLYYALKEGIPVLPLFIFDKDILEKLEDKTDKRVVFIHQCLTKLNTQLTKQGSALTVLHDTPLNAYKKLTEQYVIKTVFTNHDYEPYAIKRDNDIADYLTKNGTAFKSFKDQVIFEKSEVMKDDGLPYTVFTPYSRKWKAKLNDFYLKPYPTEKYFSNFLKYQSAEIISLAAIGFKDIKAHFPDNTYNEKIVKHYHDTRNFPAVEGTTKLSVHLRFGTLSIRELAKKGLAKNETWLNELIWREFFMQILFHFPHVVNQSFKKQYEGIKWNNNETEFQKWCDGKTGYPIVDAGMRELNETGFMHNRVRMVVASFLVKHLLIDWRWGEAYFAKKLLDYDLSANNGNWQWAAGCGCDAAPYFRIFNPAEQTKKFDTQLIYINKWIPELNSLEYPAPIVEHVFARTRVLKVFKEALATS